MAVLVHLSILAFAVFFPLLVLATLVGSDRWLREHAVRAFNFQATVMVVWVPLGGGLVVWQAIGGGSAVLWLLVVTATLLLLLMCGSIVGPIRSAHRGEPARYWMSIRFLT
jgi:hypothetical protein